MSYLRVDAKMKPDTTKTTTTIPERAILTKRQCKHCKNEIYLQFMKLTPKLQGWISFDSSDGKLHHCSTRLLALEVKKLVQTAINRMNHATYNSNMIHTQNITSTEVIHRIDRIIEDLEIIRQSLLSNLSDKKGV